MKELVIDFRKKSRPITPVNIQGLNIETLEENKYLVVQKLKLQVIFTGIYQILQHSLTFAYLQTYLL